MLEPLLLTAARLFTFEGQWMLTNASSLFIEHDERAATAVWLTFISNA